MVLYLNLALGALIIYRLDEVEGGGEEEFFGEGAHSISRLTKGRITELKQHRKGV